MAGDSHFDDDDTTYNAADLKNAMSFYGIEGRADIEAIGGLDDFRGDGLDGNGHLEAGRQTASSCTCTGTWRCNDPPGCTCTKSWKCNPGAMIAATTEKLGLGDDFYPEDDGLDADYFGFGLDEYLGLEYVDDEPSALAADYFGGDECMAGEFAESMLESDAMTEDDLIAMGWDPFKSIKKAVRPLTKTVKSAVKTVAKQAKGAIKTVGTVAKAGIKLNPYTLLKNPKAALAAQVKAAKAVVGQVKATTRVARDLVKSPIVKTVVGGAAIVFPPVGVPAAAALATAAAVAKGVDSKIPKVAQAARKVVQNTANLAQRGDAGAQKALSLIATNKQALVAQQLTKPPAGVKRLVFDVNRAGRISRLAV